MAWRALKTMRRNPEQFFDVTIQPLLFTAMFAYVFGGAISGDVASYLPLMIPGIVAQTVLTTCMATGVQLREDMEKGVFDRFKSLPIARIAPLAGPMVADLVRYLIAASLTFVAGMVMGYRPQRRGARRAGGDPAGDLHRLGDRVDLHLGRHDRPQRPQRPGDLDDDPVPADVPVERVRPGRHAAVRAADVREHQPGLPPGLRDARPRQRRRRSPPRSAGRCSPASS